MERTIEAIYSRCIEEGDCWLWQGAVDNAGIPAMRPSGSGNAVSVRRFILEMNGRKLGALMATNTCNVRLCVNPEHAVAMTRSRLIKRAAEVSGYARQLSHSAKIAKAKRKASSLTPELVQDIRSSDESNRVIANRLGCDPATIQSIRTYKTWRDYSNPYLQLVA